MNDFNPGPGYRVATKDERMEPMPVGAVSHHGEDGWHYWVRDEPVPPLPTEPYTVIRVTWQTGGTVGRLLTLNELGFWTGEMSSTAVAEAITGFEVLSEPRAVTAKRIAEFFEAEAATTDPTNWCNSAARTIRREFRVES